jgi:hypothetical protein
MARTITIEELKASQEAVGRDFFIPARRRKACVSQDPASIAYATVT